MRHSLEKTISALTTFIHFVLLILESQTEGFLCTG